MVDVPLFELARVETLVYTRLWNVGGWRLTVTIVVD